MDKVLIFIQNEARRFKHADMAGRQYYSNTMTDTYARRLLDKKKERQFPGYLQPNLHTTDYPPEGGFDVVFEELSTKMEDAPNIIPGHIVWITRYYLRYDRPHDYYDLAAECQIPSGNSNSERFVCKLYLSLACNPAVRIDVSGVDGKLLASFGAIKTETDRFVSSMMAGPPCNSATAAGQQ